jgi:hypothetical protein
VHAGGGSEDDRRLDQPGAFEQSADASARALDPAQVRRVGRDLIDGLPVEVEADVGSGPELRPAGKLGRAQVTLDAAVVTLIAGDRQQLGRAQQPDPRVGASDPLSELSLKRRGNQHVYRVGDIR